jgi:hypothetical protein
MTLVTARTPKAPRISIEGLRRRINYDPASGSLTWLPLVVPAVNSRAVSTWNARYAGTPALACRDKLGYRRGSIGGDMLLAHRAAWAIHHGRWPTHFLDHINGNPSDNRLVNLREVDALGNSRNVRLRHNSTTGVVGVSIHSQTGQYWAQIGVGGEVLYLGVYDDLPSAAAARRNAERKYGFHPNHGRVG